MDSKQASGPGPGNRRSDLDWLTVLATLNIFFFHCARFFNFEDWHVKNNHLDPGLSLFVSLSAQWIMPLFFVLSGISSKYSLAFRNGGKYLANRARRLLVPLVFGVFVLLAPVQVWIERVGHSQFEGGLLEFYPLYFKGFYAFGGNFAWMGLHLWYLEVLFVFTLLTYPLFIVKRKERARGHVSGMSSFFTRKGAVLLLAAPVFAMELLVNMQPQGLGMRAFGGWSLLTYLVFFIVGFLTAGDDRYRAGMERSRYISLILAVSASSLMFLFPIDLTFLAEVGQYVATVLVRSLNSWSWLTTFLGFGSKYLCFSNNILKYAREAALPFYILHQTIIVVVGYYLASRPEGVLVKYLLLAAVSLAVIMAIYEFPIRRARVFRFLFGMGASASS
ncbi:MAG: acyltransferase family protein [Pseudomonadota bacterium]